MFSKLRFNMIGVLCVHINSETFDGYILLYRLGLVLRFSPVKEFYLPLLISSISTQFLQGETKRKWLFFDCDLIFISDMYVLYCYLNIVNDL
jgi:hypothetical protein